MALTYATPEELFIWEQSWPRWVGEPEAVSSLARKIDRAIHERFPWKTTVNTEFAWGRADLATGSPDVPTYLDDIRANRRKLTNVRIRVVAYEQGTPFPAAFGDDAIDNWPTKSYELPVASGTSGAQVVSIETVSPPVLVEATITSWAGAKLRVLSKSGSNGSTLWSHVLPYVEVNAGWIPRDQFYRRPVRWLLPRFELIWDGLPRWRRVTTRLATAVGIIGGLAGAVALIAR
jgi:hypothetical protein